MARVVIISQTGVGQSAWQRVNEHLSPFEVGFNAILTGTGTFSIELTNEYPTQTVPWDVIGGGSPTTPTPSPFTPTGYSGLSASTNLNLTQPCLAWRINVTAGTGTVKVEAVQAGIRGN